MGGSSEGRCCWGLSPGLKDRVSGVPPGQVAFARTKLQCCPLVAKVSLLRGS